MPHHHWAFYSGSKKYGYLPLGGEVVVTVEGESQYFFLRIIPTLDTLSIARGVTMRYELCPS